jgi:hypothetical protein
LIHEEERCSKGLVLRQHAFLVDRHAGSLTPLAARSELPGARGVRPIVGDASNPEPKRVAATRTVGVGLAVELIDSNIGWIDAGVSVEEGSLVGLWALLSEFDVRRLDPVIVHADRLPWLSRSRR